MRVITLNCNGIRSAASKGLFDWLPRQKADFLCLQEIKAHLTDLEGDIRFSPKGWHAHFSYAQKKGYSGVAIFARQKPDAVLDKLGVKEFDDEGRYLELRYGSLSVVSLYLPSGSAGPERQASKDRFLAFFGPVLAQWGASGRRYVVCGDWNIAHTQKDLKNWRSNQKNSGFLPHEREWMTTTLGPHGWRDGYRCLHPDAEGEGYTWWSNRGQAYAKNVGWRIDYHLVTKNLAAKLKSAKIYTTTRFSDHAPLILDYADCFPVRATGWTDSLGIYAHRRVAAMLFLGFSAGLPFLLVFSTLSAWLSQAGIDRGTIGLLSWVGITYSIKFFWAPVVDRLRLPLLHAWLGRRRSWMLVAQVGMACGLAGLAVHDPAAELATMVWCALLVAFSSATQDIAIDAWRIEAAERERQGAMSAAYQLGYRIALIVAGAGCLFLAAEHGWRVAYLAMAVMALVGVLTTLCVPEPEWRSATTPQAEARVREWAARNERLPRALREAGAWFVGAVVCPFVDFFQRNGLQLGIAILCFVGFFRLTDITMGSMANPFYLSLGYSLKQVAAIAKLFGVILSIVGAFLGGIAVARYGASRALMVGGILVIVSNLGFAGLALHGQPSEAGLAFVISGDNLASGFAGSAFIAYLSGLTNTAYTATQYALFSSLFTLPGKLLGGASGFVSEALGWPGFFLYTSALGIPALVLIVWLDRRLAVREAQPAAP